MICWTWGDVKSPDGTNSALVERINLRLVAVLRIAYEAADSGLLSPELAAGSRRVKGVRLLGVRVGNWLTAEQGKRLLEATGAGTLRGKRNHAMLSLFMSVPIDQQGWQYLGRRDDAPWDN